MSDNYIHSTINISGFDIPIFIISLKKDLHRRSLLSNFLPREIVENYFPGSDFRNMPSSELDQLMDIEKLFKNDIYNRKLTGGEVGCVNSHKSIYKYIVKYNLPYALILEDDVLCEKKWMIKTGKILDNLKLISNDKSFVCNIGIDYFNSVPRKYIIRSFFPIKIFKEIALVDFSKTDLWLAHSYFINLNGAKNMLSKLKKIHVMNDDWKSFYFDKSLDYVFITKCVFIQNQAIESNIRFSNIVSVNYSKIDKLKIYFISIKSKIKNLLYVTNPKNWIFFRV